MSLGIYPVFRPKLARTRLRWLGEVLAMNLEPLDAIAREAKLTPLTTFADNRPVPKDFDGDPDELAEVLGEWTEWFDAAVGQAAMQALVDHLKANPEAAARLAEVSGVVAELEDIARVLAVATAQGVKFRLEMS
jgi:hypothetical protein